MGGPKSPINLGSTGRLVPIRMDIAGDITNPGRIVKNIATFGRGGNRPFTPNESDPERVARTLPRQPNETEQDYLRRSGYATTVGMAGGGTATYSANPRSAQRLAELNERAKGWGFESEDERIRQVTNIINAFGRRSKKTPAVLGNITGDAGSAYMGK